MFSKENGRLALITTVIIAACIETDIYLPAFADMMSYFEVSENSIQSLLTWNFLGICLACPFYGPISDAYGRRKPLLFALALFALGSLMTIFASNFSLMIWGRVLQGLGSGGCFTLTTAILFDVFPKDRARIAINRLNTIIPTIMAAAPMAGGILNQNFGFRSNFLAIFIFVALSSLVCFFYFDESLSPAEQKPLDRKKLIKDFKKAFFCVPFWQTTVFISLFFSTYIGFLSIIAVLFPLELGIDKAICPLFQSAVLGAWLIASLGFNKSAKILGKNLRKVGLALTFLGAALFCLFAIALPKNPYFMTIGMMIQAVGFNFAMTIYFEEGMGWLSDIKGIAASLLTSSRLFLCSLFVGLSGKLYDKSIIPYALLSLVCYAICALVIWSYEKRYAKDDLDPSALTLSH